MASARGPFADTLNHLAGFRLANYRAHGTDDFLKKPLELNRMSRATLDTMYQVVADSKHLLLSYLQRKAQLLGKSQLDWQDIEAPLALGEVPSQTYDQAADFVIKNFQQFSPKMGALAKHALENRGSKPRIGQTSVPAATWKTCLKLTNPASS